MRMRSQVGLCIFFLSAAANVVLWLKVHTAQQPLEAAYTTNSPSAVAVTNRIISPEKRDSTKVTWQDLDDPSVPNLIANLRAVKCPEITIRDIVTERLDEQLDERIASLAVPEEFWSTAFQKDRLRQEQKEKVRALEREEEGLVREWLGTDWNRDAYLYWVFEPYNEFLFGFLPREKAMSVEFDIQNLAQTSLLAFNGDVAPRGDAQELERLNKQLKSKLSPAEYAELNLRSLVHMLHDGGFPDVPLNGADVRYIVSLYAKHLDFIDSYLRSSREFYELKKIAMTAAQDDIRNYLGADRYVAFQRAEDFGYLYLHKVAHDAGLSPDTAERIFSMKAEASRQALAISKNDTLAADLRSQQLNNLRNTYRGSVVKLLGEDRTKDYENRYEPWWNKLGEVENNGGAK